MKKSNLFLSTLLVSSILFTSCNDDDNNTPIIIDQTPTEQDFGDIRTVALNNNSQQFQFNAEDGMGVFTSSNGVTIRVDGSCLTLNNSAITGQVDVSYVELFGKGNMLTTNKPTMGVLPNGDKALLISGGEFYLNATQNGDQLDLGCSYQLEIPTNLTGGDDYDMVLWDVITDANGDIAWEQDMDPNTGGGNDELFLENGQTGGGVYYTFLGDFGWTNVDKFYNDPRPKTTILVDVPDNYDNENSAVYISFDGEDNALAHLDTYDATTGLFSEHYGQIPIGLECHIIFVTEEGGDWRYAIQEVTIVADDTITFTMGETSIATEAQLVQLINDLP